MSPFEKLAAWREAYRLVLDVYRATEPFPTTERYGLVSQIRRAAVSVTANIAEGSVKRGPREFRRYLDIARGSLAEVQSLIRLARDLGYMRQPNWEALEKQVNHTGFLTWQLYRSLQSRATGKEQRCSPEPPPTPTYTNLHRPTPTYTILHPHRIHAHLEPLLVLVLELDDPVD